VSRVAIISFTGGFMPPDPFEESAMNLEVYPLSSWPTATPSVSPSPTAAEAHPATLTVKEVARLYDGVAFAMWQHGVVMNAHLTFDWGQIGATDAAHAVKILGSFNHEAAKWLRVGKFDKDAIRAGRRFGHGTEFYYVHVHENGGAQGFHTHQLCFVPAPIAPLFVTWSRKCLARLTGQTSIPRTALDIKIKRSLGEGQDVTRCWAWFRYIIKQLDTNRGILDNEGQWRTAVSVFKPWTKRQLLPLPVEKAVKISHNLGRTAQRAFGFPSRYLAGHWSELYDGRELDERRERLRDERRQAEFEQMLPVLRL